MRDAIPLQLPQHVAIVMDGNGRWAKRRGLPRIAGHKKGVESAKAIIQACINKKIPILTMWAFGIENWQRPETEVSFLMDLFLNTLKNEARSFNRNNIQLRVIGDKARLNSKLNAIISQTEEATSNNTGLKLNLAISYSGRWDIMQAMRKVGEQIQAGDLTAEEITGEIINANLCLAGLPEPDLFIRTSGELRISNFLLWQLAYTELYFTETMWPDFRDNEFDLALQEYTRRERRFGKVGE